MGTGTRRERTHLFATGPGDSRLRVVFASDIVTGNGFGNPLLLGPLYGTGGLFVG